MTQKALRDFLNYKSKADMLSQCKLWVLLYSIFTVLFVDLSFFINSGEMKDNKILLFINATLTILSVLFVVVYKKKRMNTTQIFLFESIIVFGISGEFFYLFLLKSIAKIYSLSVFHFIVSFVMTCFVALTLLYRIRLLKKGKKSSKKEKKSPQKFIALFSVGVGITFCLRFIFNNEIKNELLGYSLIILSFIFLIIASIDFQNSIICKRYGFDELVCSSTEDGSA